MKKRAVYPGTFDPLTLGHFDLIERSARLFPELLVAVAAYANKGTGMFDLPERIAMVEESVKGFPNVSVAPLDCLLVDFCAHNDIQVVIRGLRAYSDFEYEFQMALTNRRLAPEVETLFMMPQEEHSYVTASTVREIARYGGNTSSFLPTVAQRYVARFVGDNPDQILKAQKGRTNGSGAFDN